MSAALDLRGSGPAAAPSPREAGGLLTVDLGALADNWRLLAARAEAAECAAVVKADAYGIGLAEAARALREAGCRTFFVAQVSEGIAARAACPDADIYVLNGLLPGSASAYGAHHLRPVLGSREELVEWAAFNRIAATRLPAAIHVDTGMNRLGLRVEDALALPGDPLLADVVPALLMSHLVSAELPEDPQNTRQIEIFAAVRAAFPDLPASLCNSAGIFLPEAPHLDLVRPGYALYGGNPTPGRDNPMRPVVRLEARIVQIRDVLPGETVGYNGQWTAGGPRRLATLSVGYADGYPRAASASDAGVRAGTEAGAAVIAGQRCPFAGRVSMDLLSVDITGLPETAVRRGDPAVLIGEGLDLDEVGRRAGTIGYEILTGLGRRYARAYLGG